MCNKKKHENHKKKFFSQRLVVWTPVICTCNCLKTCMDAKLFFACFSETFYHINVTRDNVLHIGIIKAALHLGGSCFTPKSFPPWTFHT